MDPEDEDLIRRAREGDQPSREELFRRHADYVVRVLYRLAEGVNRTKGGELILDHSEFKAAVEDLARTAFAEAFAQMASFDQTRGASLTTWIVWKGRARLRQVVGSAIRDKISRELQVDAESIEELPPHLRATYLPGPWGDDPEDMALKSVQRTEHRQKIEAVPRALPEEWARALVLGYELFDRKPWPGAISVRVLGLLLPACYPTSRDRANPCRNAVFVPSQFPADPG